MTAELIINPRFSEADITALKDKLERVHGPGEWRIDYAADRLYLVPADRLETERFLSEAVSRETRRRLFRPLAWIRGLQRAARPSWSR